MVSLGVSTVQRLFSPNLSRKKYDFHLPCSAVSAVTRPVIIHRLGKRRGKGLCPKMNSLVEMTQFWKSWSCALICTACYKSVIHAFLTALPLNFIMVWVIMAEQLPCKLSIYSVYSLSLSAACEVGFYKPVAGDGLCGKCPQHSHSETRAALSCPCDSNYYRAADDPAAASCSRKHKHSVH